jgi:hypothetical protein
MATGFDEPGAVPPAADDAQPASPAAGVGRGWTFDEDISWGYDEATGARAAPGVAAGVTPESAAMRQAEQTQDLGVAALRPPPPGAPAPAPSARPDPGRAEPGPVAGTPQAPPSPVPTAGPADPVSTAGPATTAGPMNMAGPMDMTVPATARAPLAMAGPRAAAPDAGTPEGPEAPHPARMVLGMATLAADRLRGGAPGGEAFFTGVGLMQQTAAGARNLAKRMLGPASQAALDTVDLAAQLPVAGAPLRSLARTRDRMARALADARTRGHATVAAGRADAEAFVRSNVAETISWAQARAVPQIVDGLVPHLVDEVVPRILEGTLPEIRATVLPAVIDDLTNSPQLRDLMLEQGRGVVGDAAEHLRNTTANADDRVESAFRRLVRAPAPGPTDQPANGG